MKPTIALKRYLEDGDSGRKTTASELLELKRACAPAGEWERFAQDAAAAIGVELDAGGDTGP